MFVKLNTSLGGILITNFISNQNNFLLNTKYSTFILYRRT